MEYILEHIQKLMDETGVLEVSVGLILWSFVLLGIILGTWVSIVIKIMFILPLSLLIQLLKSIIKLLEWIIEKIDIFFTKSRDFIKTFVKIVSPEDYKDK